MKKIVFLVLLILPLSVFGAPSVRVLGSSVPTKVSALTTTQKETSSNSSTARIGTLRAKKTNTATSTSTSGSRFPVATTVGKYTDAQNSVQRQTGRGITPTVTAAVDTDAITNTVTQAVLQNVQENYYDKREVYDNNKFDKAVKQVEDPRKDAIRVGSKPVYSESLPAGYAYIWIEE